MSFVASKDVPLDVQTYLKKHFSIDPNTGRITRSDRRNSNGSYDKDGYLILKIKGKQYKAHRVAWFLYYGEFPSLEIDHIDRDRSNNRKSNLRVADRVLNTNNTHIHKNKDTGVIGVYLDKCTEGLKKVYTTRFNGKTYRFYTLLEAVNFRKKHGKRV